MVIVAAVMMRKNVKRDFFTRGDTSQRVELRGKGTAGGGGVFLGAASGGRD
jgi:hypothetical protein